MCADKDAIAYGIKKLPMRWSKEQVDIIKRVWETIDLDLDQKVTR